jgi:hypothetical protein
VVHDVGFFGLVTKEESRLSFTDLLINRTEDRFVTRFRSNAIDIRVLQSDQRRFESSNQRLFDVVP